MNSNLNNIFHPKIWVLVDNRVGNANQALALAAKLNADYQVKTLQYNCFANLPNCLLAFWPIHVKKAVLDELKSQNAPDIIISSGRRTATLAIYLKKISKNKAKVIQIMRPGLNPKKFDLIILPQHDNYNYTLPNIVRIIGALNNVQASMPKAKTLLKNNYPDIKHFIAVIIGGSSKRYNFTTSNAELLSDTIGTISENHSLPLFITFSRRTPKQVKEIFRNKFLWPNIIYDPEENLPNPYPAIIGEGEYIITTTDSISMCSEAASTGKPIYVFCPEDFKLKKHRFFIQQLADLGIVKLLESSTTFLAKYNYEPLHETDKVAEIVKERFLINNKT
jgi:mitochondrial fission protein ELM1